MPLGCVCDNHLMIVSKGELCYGEKTLIYRGSMLRRVAAYDLSAFRPELSIEFCFIELPPKFDGVDIAKTQNAETIRT